jgi:hypothetical protein
MYAEEGSHSWAGVALCPSWGCCWAILWWWLVAHLVYNTVNASQWWRGVVAQPTAELVSHSC